MTLGLDDNFFFADGLADASVFELFVDFTYFYFRGDLIISNID